MCASTQPMSKVSDKLVTHDPIIFHPLEQISLTYLVNNVTL